MNFYRSKFQEWLLCRVCREDAGLWLCRFAFRSTPHLSHPVTKTTMWHWKRPFWPFKIRFHKIVGDVMEATSIFYIVCGVYSGCPIFVATTEKVNLTEYSCLTVIFSALTGFCIYCCHTHIQAKRRIETVSKAEMKECTLAAKCTKICQSGRHYKKLKSFLKLLL